MEVDPSGSTSVPQPSQHDEGPAGTSSQQLPQSSPDSPDYATPESPLANINPIEVFQEQITTVQQHLRQPYAFAEAEIGKTAMDCNDALFTLYRGVSTLPPHIDPEPARNALLVLK